MATFGKPSGLRIPARSSAYEMRSAESRDLVDGLRASTGGYENPAMLNDPSLSLPPTPTSVHQPVILQSTRRPTNQDVFIPSGGSSYQNEAYISGSNSELDVRCNNGSFGGKVFSISHTMPSAVPRSSYTPSSLNVAGTTSASGKQKHSAACMRGFAAGMTVLIVLVLAAVATVLYLWLGTNKFSPTHPPTTIPNGATFNCEVAINRSWSDDLYNVSSLYYSNLSATFTAEIRAAFASTSTYSGMQILNFRPGSIVVVFLLRFNLSYDLPTAQMMVASAIGACRIPIVESSLAISVGNLAAVKCGDGFFYCDNACRHKMYRCNGNLDCADWKDEAGCPDQSVTCSFDDPSHCGYQQLGTGSYEWLPKSGPTPTKGTGPQADHTFGNATGVYYYTEASCFRCKEGVSARLLSPLFTISARSCVTFYYYMYGSSTGMGSLNLLALNPLNDNEPQLLWTRQGNLGPVWLRAAVELQPNVYAPTSDWAAAGDGASVYQLVFESHYGSSSLGDKAIDDVAVTQGSCPAPVCASSEHHCSLSDTCIALNQICDGWFDCPDLSDEVQCKGFVVSCAFENHTTCGLAQGHTTLPSYVWTIVLSVSSARGVDSYFDRTKGNEYGLLAFVDGELAISGDQSELLTPRLPSLTPICLQLYYRCTDGRLRALARNSETVTVLLWQTVANTTTAWQRLQMSIGPQPWDYNLTFEATSWGGDIAIDDITVRSGLCQATAAQLLCPSNQLIPNEWLCDGQSDCSDSSDEADCGVCRKSQFRCRDTSCVDGGTSIICDGINDCKDGSDEQEPCATQVLDVNGQPRINMYDSSSASYYEVCYQGWNSNLTGLICTYLGSGFTGQALPVPGSNSSATFLQVTKSSMASGSGLLPWRLVRTLVPSCIDGLVVRVTCVPDICGQTADVPVAYLIGGSNADTLSHPWQVSVRSSTIGHLCGGTLVGPHWVLSAAHCFHSSGDGTVDASAFTVLLGSTSVDPGVDTGSLLLGVSRVVIHPQFVNVYQGFDAALLLLDRPVIYSDRIRPACLPHGGDLGAPDLRALCEISGWGLFSVSPKQYPTALQVGKTKIYPSALCNATAQSYGGSVAPALQLCAGYRLGTIRTCQADSGGPLACLGPDRRWYVYGVTSFGPPACIVAVDSPDVFTRVSSVSDWVRAAADLVFQCSSGLVLYAGADGGVRCDGIDDCGDGGSDERLLCPQSIACSFEPPSFTCGWYDAEPFSSSRMPGRGWAMARGSAVSLGLAVNGGPSFDHTTGLSLVGSNGTGAYMFAPAGVVGAKLLAPASRSSSSPPGCLQFYYHSRAQRPGSLSVGTSASTSPLWTSGGSGGGGSDDWLFGQVDLPAGNYTLFFSADVPPQPSGGGIGVDDVALLLDVPCPTADGLCSSPPTAFLCADRSTCIGAALRCDLACHCADCSDEAPTVCNLAARSSFSCDFGEPHACGLRQSVDDDFDWTVAAGRSPLNGTGPSGGGRLSVAAAYYVAKAAGVGLTAAARLLVMLDGTTAQQYCLSFYYCMNGIDVGVLRVEAGANDSSGGGNSWTVWKNWGNKGADWKLALVNISSSTRVIAFVTEAGWPVYNHVALADLGLTRGPCQPLPVSCGGSGGGSDQPAAAAASAAASTALGPQTAALLSPQLWPCREECIALSRVCDGMVDCTDLSDETNCSWGSVTGPLYCDFGGNAPCGYTTRGTATWSLAAGAQPDGASSPNSTGHYMSSKPDLTQVTSAAVLLFPSIYVGASSGCVQFDYAILGSTPGAASLLVDLNDTRLNYSRLLWTSNGLTESTAWRHVGVPLPAASLGRVQFEAIFSSDIADASALLGSVSIVGSSCNVSFLCEPGAFKCGGGEYLCVGQQSVCDGQPDCSDGSDERNCTGSALDCNFEASLCGWQSQGWTIRSAGAPTDLTDPTVDHTFGNSSGHFLYTPVSSDASLISPAYDFSSPYCFTFSYYMASHGIGALTVHFDTKIVLELKGVQGGMQWWTAKVPIEVSTLQASSQQAITIVASQGTPAYGGGVAIDDIVVRKGECDCSKSFRCNSSECLPLDGHCNYQLQCLDGSDEPPNCPCPQGGIRCPHLGDTCHDAEYVCSLPYEVCFLAKHNYTMCNCSDTFYQCRNGLCIDLGAFCNGFQDCEDDDDELPNCSQVKAASYFECTANKVWWPKWFLCDGHNQCPDGQDEQNCGTTTASAGRQSGGCQPGKLFVCLNGYVIGPGRCCDGYDDCGDDSDELANCPCLPKQRACIGQPGRCIPNEWFCDSVIDCDNASDELGCGTCQPGQFTCRNYECINETLHCDGVNQCSDGSDESSCWSIAASGTVRAACTVDGHKQMCSVCSSPWQPALSDGVCAQVGRGPSAETRAVAPTGQLPLPELLVHVESNASSLIATMQPAVTGCVNRTVLSISCYPPDCGASAKNVPLVMGGIVPYILGGNIVSDRTWWPWAVSIYFSAAFTGCGAVASIDWIVTAAHVIVVVSQTGAVTRRDNQTSLFSFGLGTVYLDSGVASNATGSAVAASQIYVHPQLFRNNTLLLNDIALIRLRSPLQTSATIRPACLPTAADASSLALSSVCYLTGWGTLDGSGVPATQLREAKMRLLSDGACRLAWPNAYNSSVHLCAGYAGGLPSGCSGDSGAPLVCLYSNGRWVLAGILSFGGACRSTSAPKPNVFTRVSAMSQWMTAVMAATDSSGRNG